MRSTLKSALALSAIACFAFSLIPNPASSQTKQTANLLFQLTSSEFQNQTTLPISTINDNIVNG
jgi:hypothetical protein